MLKILIIVSILGRESIKIIIFQHNMLKIIYTLKMA